MSFLSLTAYVLSVIGSSWAIQQCLTVPNAQCSCRYGNGSVVDLAPLGNKDGTPRYKDIAGSPANYKYSYNPCYPFTETLGTGSYHACKNAAACQLDSTYNGDLAIGYHKGVFAVNSTGFLSIEYKVDKSRDPLQQDRLTHVDLICASVEKLTALGDTAKYLNYVLVLESPQVCPRDPASNGGGHKLSPGSVLIIIAVVLAFVYFVGGVVFMHFVKQQNGTDMIPNKAFWTDLPFLVKDGALFVV